MGELVFVGLGIADERQMTLRGLEEAREADLLFAELYTSHVPADLLAQLAPLIGKEPVVLGRRELEDEAGRVLLDPAETRRVVLLVPGDPLIATTHLSLRIEAFKRGVETRVVNAPSILTAAIGASGLQNYRFGPSFTLPSMSESLPDSLYDVAKENHLRRLHTFVFLDVGGDGKPDMTIAEGVAALLNTESRREEGVFRRDRLAVGLARVGYDSPIVKADALASLSHYSFGPPPHCLILPGRLHFMEAKALEYFAGAPKHLLSEAERLASS